MGKTSDSRMSVRTRGTSESVLRTRGKRSNHGDADPQALLTPEALRRYLKACICPYCGRGPFQNIVGHTVRLHDVDGKELRDAAGLPYNHSLTAPELHAKNVAKSKGRDMDELRAAKFRKIEAAGGTVRRTLSKAARAKNLEKLANVDREKASRLAAEKLRGEYEARVQRAAPAIRRGVDENRTFAEIASELRVDPATIGRYAKALGLGDGRSLPAASNSDMSQVLAASRKSAQEERDSVVAEWEASDKSWDAVGLMAESRSITKKAMVARLRSLGLNPGDGRRLTTNRYRGHRKLTEEDVRAIRKARTERTPVKDLAARFKVSEGTITEATLGKKRYAEIS